MKQNAVFSVDARKRRRHVNKVSILHVQPIIFKEILLLQSFMSDDFIVAMSGILFPSFKLQ